MTRFLGWRKMTWAILLANVGIGAWAIGGGGLVPITIVWSVGIAVLTVGWFMSRPLWRQGHGARLRRLRSPASSPIRSFEKLPTG